MSFHFSEFIYGLPLEFSLSTTYSLVEVIWYIMKKLVYLWVTSAWGTRWVTFLLVHKWRNFQSAQYAKISAKL